MGRWGTRWALWGIVLAAMLVVSVAWAQAPARPKLERLKIAVAPLGWDTNYSWLQSRSGMLDKRPALEYLVGIERNTGAYIPELAEKWEMAPDGKSWTLWLRQGVHFHEKWGEFTAKDVRHAIFLISQPEKELECRWVPEGVTRLATLIAGEVHISDIDRALQKDAVDKGMQVIPGKLAIIGHEWLFGGMYFATLDKLDNKQPFVDKRVRQAMNMAINRQAIATNILGGKAQPMRVTRFHPQADETLWPGIWNPEWEKRAEELYGYNPLKAKKLLEEAGYQNGFEFTIKRRERCSVTSWCGFCRVS